MKKAVLLSVLLGGGCGGGGSSMPGPDGSGQASPVDGSLSSVDGSADVSADASAEASHKSLIPLVVEVTFRRRALTTC